MFNKIDYSKLHHLAIGRIGEYWTKIVLTLNGLDVFVSEVDNKGIDFIVRNNKNRYFDIQVKTVRFPSTKYVFMTKEAEWSENNLRDSLYLALVIIKDQEIPKLYLIPSTAWEKENDLLRNRLYGNGKKSKPEWGLNISAKNFHILKEYEMEYQINKMK